MSNYNPYYNFVATRGQKCPFCDSDDLHVEPPEQDDQMKVRTWNMCNNCRSDWYVVYSFLGLAEAHDSQKAQRIRRGEYEY